MPLRPRLLTCLRLTVALLTVTLAVLSFVRADRLEQHASESRRARAEEDARRSMALLNHWLDTRHQALRGVAALFLASTEVSAQEYAHAATVLQAATSGGKTIGLAYAEEDAHGVLRLRYNARGINLPIGADLSRNAGLLALLPKATSGNIDTQLGPMVRGAGGRAWAYHAYPLLRHGKRAMAFTRIDFTEMLATLPKSSLTLRLAIATTGQPAVFVVGEARDAGPNTLHQTTYRANSRWDWYWEQADADVDGNGYSRWLTSAFRWGSLIAIVLLGAGTLVLLELYVRSQRREAELELARTQLEDSETHSRTLIDQLPGAVFRCRADSQWTMLYLSPAITTLTGLPPEALIQNRDLSFADLIHPDDRSRVAHEIRYALVGEEPYEIEYRLLPPGGQVRWIAERGRSVHLGQARLIDGMLLDIGARKAAEAAQAEANTLLRAIVDNTPNVAIQGYDIEGRVLFWNRASERLFGWSEAETVGRVASEFMFGTVDHQNFLGVLQHIAATGEVTEPTEWPVTRRDGSIAWTLSTQFQIIGQNGEATYVCMDVDITMRKQYEDELRQTHDRLEELVAERTGELRTANDELKQAMNQLVQSEKLASLGSLVAGIAHELNTPLGNTVTVSSTLQQKVAEFRTLLQENRLKRSELESFLEISIEAAQLIEKSAQRASELISNFKQVAVDTASTRRREFNLKQTIDEVMSTLRPQLKHTPHQVEIDLPHDVQLESYPGPLEQVLTNLVLNSLAHGLTQEQPGHIRIHAALLDARNVQLVYQDDGRGIPEPLRRRVFDPFFTTRLGQGGSGLGLYIVYNLIYNVLGGKLALDDAPGGGARFTVTLPITAPHPQEDHDRPS
ncbi:MAG TPA: PAS domain-containing sensor histidine kinase [Chitinolyticbacter sp.]|nr:PAS domain-containing sensor histidine kinase [Chitinolyticbacter sp.]